MFPIIAIAGAALVSAILAAGCGDSVNQLEPEPKPDAFLPSQDSSSRDIELTLDARQKPDAFVPPIGTNVFENVSCGLVPVMKKDIPLDNDPGFTWTQECKIDFIVPQFKDPNKKAPLILWFPGGGYSSLHVGPQETKELSDWALNNGWAIAIVKYYLATSTDAPGWPYAYMSAKKAVGWAKDVNLKNDQKYGFDATKLVAAGFSAGGTMASFLGVTSSLNYDFSSSSCDITKPNFKETCLANKADQSTVVAGIVAANAPTDLTVFQKGTITKASHKEFYNAVSVFLGILPEAKQPLYAEAASPITYAVSLAAKTPYWAFIYGEADKTVPMSQSITMISALKNAGVKNVMDVFALGRQHNKFWPHPDGGSWLEYTLKQVMTAVNKN